MRFVISNMVTLALVLPGFGIGANTFAGGKPTPQNVPLDLGCLTDAENRTGQVPDDNPFMLPGMPPSAGTLQALRSKVRHKDGIRIGPVRVEDDGTYMSSNLPAEDNARVDIGHFKSADIKRGYIGVRIFVVPKDGCLEFFGPRRKPDVPND